MSTANSTYVFAYGSLLWRPGFEYLDVHRVCVQGYERRFWQASHDHRGTDSHPGRVVTLVPVVGAVCEGLAYRLSDQHREKTLTALDKREQDGYQRVWLPSTVALNGVLDSVLTWVAPAGNPSWVGDEPIALTAELIATRSGLSGSNLEYLLELYSALNRLEIEDAHIQELVRLQNTDFAKAVF